MRALVFALALLLAGCATDPPSPQVAARQAKLDQCLAAQGRPSFSAYLYGEEVRVHYTYRMDEGAGMKERRQQAINALFACMGVQRKP